jgi:pimeloyl-ACP methyl ester carboxylesterase
MPLAKEYSMTSTIARADSPARTNPTVTHYHTATIDGIDLFYREAGPSDAPAVVLLHGFPSSSRMFRNLIPQLADTYHVIAPDYPAFGHSAMPDRQRFTYTFARFTEVIDALLDQLGAHRYALYLNDFGAPIGYQLALKHPAKVMAIVAQNGAAYREGFGAYWKPVVPYWADGSAVHRDGLRPILALASTRGLYLDGVRDVSLIDPDNWVIDQALLDRPGIADIMLDLFYDIRNYVALLPEIHRYFQSRQPPMLIVWGVNDQVSTADNARTYLKDLPRAELHLLDTGHFALEDKGDEIAVLMHNFLDRYVPRA